MYIDIMITMNIKKYVNNGVFLVSPGLLVELPGGFDGEFDGGVLLGTGVVTSCNGLLGGFCEGCGVGGLIGTSTCGLGVSCEDELGGIIGVLTGGVVGMLLSCNWVIGVLIGGVVGGVIGVIVGGGVSTIGGGLYTGGGGIIKLSIIL